MMRKTIEASLVLSLSLVITLLVVAMVVPRHSALGQRPAVDGSMIRPAVFVEGIHHRPGEVGSGPSCPFMSPRTDGRECPYLAAIAAESRCPVLSGRLTGSGCPYLSPQLERPPATADPDFPKLAHFEGRAVSDSNPM